MSENNDEINKNKKESQIKSNWDLKKRARTKIIYNEDGENEEISDIAEDIKKHMHPPK